MSLAPSWSKQFSRVDLDGGSSIYLAINAQLLSRELNVLCKSCRFCFGLLVRTVLCQNLTEVKSESWSCQTTQWKNVAMCTLIDHSAIMFVVYGNCSVGLRWMFGFTIRGNFGKTFDLNHFKHNHRVFYLCKQDIEAKANIVISLPLQLPFVVFYCCNKRMSLVCWNSCNYFSWWFIYPSDLFSGSISLCKLRTYLVSDL